MLVVINENIDERKSQKRMSIIRKETADKM